MIDFVASSNVMPYLICKKLNAKPTPCEIQISQLDRSKVKIIGELKGVMIRMATNPQIFQVIDVVAADIPDVYGLFLSRDWSQALKGYFSTDWSHLWLPKNGHPNQIRIDRERYMKHTMTEINDPNQPVFSVILF